MSKAKKLARSIARIDRKHERLNAEMGRQLCEILISHVGERYEDQKHGEGAVDTLLRIIRERDAALTILALDRLKRPY